MSRHDREARFAEDLREARKRSGLSQQAVADHFGLERQSVGAWEAGRSLPNAMQLRELAVLLDNASILGVRESGVTYSTGSSPELRGVHSVPLKGQLSPIHGGIWMNTKTPDELVGRRVLWNKSAPELYAYQVIGDELHPRVQAGEFIVVDSTAPPKAGEEVLLELADGRHAVLRFIAQSDGRFSFQQIGHDPRPVTLPESEVAAMHYIAAIVKSGDWVSEFDIGTKADV